MILRVGRKEFIKFKKGEKLTRKQAILAFCYDCNGEHARDPIHGIDCKGEKTCPMYQYFPYRKK